MRRTRSSARREANESGDDEEQQEEEEEEAVLVPRVVAQPPPPPPPPPRRRRSINNNNNNNATMETVAVQTTTFSQSSSWTMTLLSRRSSSPIRIAVTNNMTPETLGRCILQATHGYCDYDFDFDSLQVVVSTSCACKVCLWLPSSFLFSPFHSHSHTTTTTTTTKGLFCYSTNVFMSLQHILNSAPQDRGCVFSLEKKQPPPHVPWYLQWQNIILLASAAFYCLYQYGNTILSTLVNVYKTLLDTMINLPLQEFYRNAPAFLGGWEGQSLPEICARITFHGDSLFWKRNLQECERIFSYKEQAYLRIMKPGVYGILLVTIVYIGRLLVREYALHQRPPHNREMVETYHAIQILTRQFNKRQSHHQHHKDM